MSEAASTTVLAVFLIFCRIGTCMMVAPGFSRANIPIQVRLFLAVTVSLMFVCVLLAAGMLALEREEHAFGRLVRGLVGRTALLAEKIALVPEDRRQQGLFMVAGINRNIAMESFKNLMRGLFLDFKKERELTDTWKKKLSIKYDNQRDPVERLSGGNQQKVVLAKWLATDPDILIVDEPTRGIDVGTKAEVHRLVNQAASEGKAVLMISSELPEVLGMADRIIVMREGHQVAEFSRAEATQEKVIAAATTGVGA